MKIEEVDPRLVALLRQAADEWGALGVALAAIRLTDREAVLARVDDRRNSNVDALAERLARRFHAAYERLAPAYGYATREDSRVPWDEVPMANRALMTGVCRQLLHEGIVAGGRAIGLGPEGVEE